MHTYGLDQFIGLSSGSGNERSACCWEPAMRGRDKATTGGHCEPLLTAGSRTLFDRSDT